MKLLVDQKTLMAALEVVHPAIVKDPVIPALWCYKFEVTTDALSITATNLDLQIKHTIPVESDSVFSFLFPVRWYKLIKKLKGLIEIRYDNFSTSVELKCDNVTVRSNVFPLNYFPKERVLKEGKPLAIITPEMVNEAQGQIPFLNKDDLRRALTGVLIEVDKDGISFTGTNANMLRTRTFEHVENGMVAIPSPSQNILHPQFVKNMIEGFMMVEASGGKVYIFNNTTDIICNTIDEKYPDYRTVIPADRKNEDTGVKCEFDRDEFLHHITMAEMLCDMSKNVKVIIGANLDIYSVNNYEIKYTYHAKLIPAIWEGSSIATAFHIPLLRTALKTQPKILTMQMLKPLGACLFMDGKSKTIVMPTSIEP